MNLQPYFEYHCDHSPACDDAPGPWRRLVRVVRGHRPSLRTFIVVADASNTPLPPEMPEDLSTVIKHVLPAHREEVIEVENWHREDGHNDSRKYETSKELRAAGFRLESQAASREFVVVCPWHGNHQTTTAQLRGPGWIELQIVFCTWPREEDEFRFANIKEQLAERLLVRLTAPAKAQNAQQQRPLAG